MPTDSRGTPVALLCGDDEYGVKQRAKALYDAWCAEAGGMDHEVVEAGAANSAEALDRIAKLREALDTLPFFGAAKVVWFRNCNFLGEDRTASSAAVTEALAGLAEMLRAFRWEGVRLLISATKPDKRRALFRTLEKLGQVAMFTALSQDDKDWVGRAEGEVLRLMRERGMEIEDEAMAELVNRVGADLRAIASETEKLSLYAAGRGRVVAGDVRVIVSRQKHARAFALAEALGDRDLRKLLRTLDEELWEIRAGTDRKKSEIGLLYGLISKIRALLMLHELQRLGHLKPSRDYNAFKRQLDGVPAAEMPEDRRFNPLSSHPFVLFQALRQSANYTADELVQAMGVLLDANQKLVGSGLDEAAVLQRAAVEIVGLRPVRSAVPR